MQIRSGHNNKCKHKRFIHIKDFYEQKKAKLWKTLIKDV